MSRSTKADIRASLEHPEGLRRPEIRDALDAQYDEALPLAENLVADPGEEGALRQRAVDISGTVYRPSGVPQMIRECFDLLIAKVREIPDPFEQAFFLNGSHPVPTAVHRCVGLPAVV